MQIKRRREYEEHERDYSSYIDNRDDYLHVCLWRRLTRTEQDSAAYNDYIDYLKNAGIELQNISSTENSVIDSQMKVASVNLDSNSIVVNIIPEDFRVVAIVKNLSEGASETLDFTELTFNKIEISKEVYPEDTSSVYLCYQENLGYSYVTLRGKVKNTSSIDLEGRYINAFVTIDDKYTYDCSVIFGANPAALTDYAIAPFEKSPLYIVAQIPEEAISAMTDGVFTVQFNENFERGAGEYMYNYNFVIPN